MTTADVRSSNGLENRTMTVVNDMDLILAVLATAEEPGYLLVDDAVYVRGPTTVHERHVERAATADEAQAVHQLVNTGYLNVGAGQYWYVAGKRVLEGRHVLTTKRGRVCRLRWSALKPLPGRRPAC
jgi:hypothetical protein